MLHILPQGLQIILCCKCLYTTLVRHLQRIRERLSLFCRKT